MERTILFKAKRLDNGEWVEGYYVKKVAHKQTPKGDVVEDGEEHLIFGMTKTDVQPYWYEVDPSTVCQFTGLKDNGGADIYEGDYLSSIYDYPKQKKVVFKNGSFCLDMYYRGLDFLPLACCDIRAGKLVEFEISDRKEGEK